jgi:glycosyltransferase involved in cell wall biosynthesis
MNNPMLSFIVLCYNYEHYIGLAIRSILDQTIQDFEIVVVDDGSSDGSRGVISSFGDPRIRLLVNERNIGGAASYNRAVQAAAGKYLVNLDADDWIVPQKSEIQLGFLEQNRVEVLGTYATLVDANGDAHPMSAEFNTLINRPHDLNTIAAWVGENHLVRSSTIVEREAHLRVGLDDPAMFRACDYELWTRFLRAGCRFAVIPEQLTYYRRHARGVTHQDPRGTLLEMSYAMLRNLVPLIEARATYQLLIHIVQWIISHDSFPRLLPIEQYRLLGLVLCRREFHDFRTFCMSLSEKDGDAELVAAGRGLLAMTILRDFSELHKLRADLTAVTEARDFWYQQSAAWESEAKALNEQIVASVGQGPPDMESLPDLSEIHKLHADLAAVTEARDFWYRTSAAWERQATALSAPSSAGEIQTQSTQETVQPTDKGLPGRVRSFLRHYIRAS